MSEQEMDLEWAIRQASRVMAELTALREQVETLTRERDEARDALDALWLWASEQRTHLDSDPVPDGLGQRALAALAADRPLSGSPDPSAILASQGLMAIPIKGGVRLEPMSARERVVALLDALQDRLGESSGKLIKAQPVVRPAREGE